MRRQAVKRASVVKVSGYLRLWRRGPSSFEFVIVLSFQSLTWVLAAEPEQVSARSVYTDLSARLRLTLADDEST